MEHVIQQEWFEEHLQAGLGTVTFEAAAFKAAVEKCGGKMVERNAPFTRNQRSGEYFDIIDTEGGVTPLKFPLTCKWVYANTREEGILTRLDPHYSPSIWFMDRVFATLGHPYKVVEVGFPIVELPDEVGWEKPKEPRSGERPVRWVSLDWAEKKAQHILFMLLFRGVLTPDEAQAVITEFVSKFMAEEAEVE